MHILYRSMHKSGGSCENGEITGIYGDIMFS